jgi:hypothetical protein
MDYVPTTLSYEGVGPVDHLWATRSGLAALAIRRSHF